MEFPFAEYNETSDLLEGSALRLELFSSTQVSTEDCI